MPRPEFIVQDVSLEALEDNRLVMALQCPICGHQDRVDFQGGAFRYGHLGFCENCRELPALTPGPLKAAFVEKLGPALEQAESDDDSEAFRRLGRVIANAAILMKPVLQIIIVGFFADIIGHHLNFTANFLGRLRKSRCPDPLMFAMPPRPGGAANDFVTTLWSRTFIVTPAAGVAYDLLRQRDDQEFTNTAFEFRHDYWGYEFALADTIKFAPDTPMPKIENRQRTVRMVPNIAPPKRADNLIDLRDPYWFVDSRGDQIAAAADLLFLREDHLRAEAALAVRGLAGRQYVCFLGRDPVYYDNKSQRNPSRESDCYHFRNIDIKTYIPSMLWLAERGVVCFRMGAGAREQLAPLHPLIVDLTAEPRTREHEFLDIYLAAHCRFYVSCSSGPDAAALIAGRPVLMVNNSTLIHAMLNNLPTLTMSTKRIRERRTGRVLSFREMLERGYDNIGANPYLVARDALEPVEDSAGEILAQVQEMEARIEGRWVESEDEIALRAAFNSLIAEFYPGFESAARMSADFLLRNRHLLEDAPKESR